MRVGKFTDPRLFILLTICHLAATQKSRHQQIKDKVPVEGGKFG